MNCPFCSTSNRPKAKFCSNCGSPLDLWACPKCEAVNHRNATVCFGCGYALTAAEPSGGDEAIQRIESASSRFVDQTSALAAKSGSVDPLLAGWEEEVQRQLVGEQFDSIPSAYRTAAPSASSRRAEAPALGAMTTPVDFHADEPAPANPSPSTRQSGLLAISPDEIERAAHLLASYLGPIAKVLAKTAAAHAADTAQLYSLLAQHIPEESDRKRFLACTQTTSRGDWAAEISAFMTVEEVHRTTRLLAAHVGPIAIALVKKVAVQVADKRQFCLRLAEHLSSESDKQRFLESVRRECPTMSEAYAGYPMATCPFMNSGDMQRATRLLAGYVGPIAVVLVKTAAAEAEDEQQFYLLLASHIIDDADKERFFESIADPSQRTKLRRGTVAAAIALLTLISAGAYACYYYDFGSYLIKLNSPSTATQHDGGRANGSDAAGTDGATAASRLAGATAAAYRRTPVSPAGAGVAAQRDDAEEVAGRRVIVPPATPSKAADCSTVKGLGVCGNGAND